MRSRRDTAMRIIVFALLVTIAVPSAAAAAQQQSSPPRTAVPDDAEMAKALESVKADPNLAAERTIKTLRWKNSNQPRRSGTPAWLAWIAGLIAWLERSARVLVWGAAVVLVAMLIVYAVRLVRTYAAPIDTDAFVPPTHVRELDIRPETLPDDIGAAARALWDRGEHRAALALLYRGLLSRLAHVHGVPIRDSSTEGDCLALAATYLTQGRREYVSQLLRIWQRAVYGRENVPAGTVYGLCDDFGPTLNAASGPVSPAGSATA